MPMRQKGLAKLTEECGELLQVAGKMVQYPELQLLEENHPDGTNLRDRAIEEMGDVLAAVSFVARKLNLNQSAILRRRDDKLGLFEKWDNEP